MPLGDGEGMAPAASPVRHFVPHPQMDGEPLMDSAGIGEVRAALAAFPGLAGVVVIEHDAGRSGQCLIAYVAPTGPGLDVPELHAYARKALLNGSMPAAIVVLDEIPVTAAGTDPLVERVQRAGLTDGAESGLDQRPPCLRRALLRDPPALGGRAAGLADLRIQAEVADQLP